MSTQGTTTVDFGTGKTDVKVSVSAPTITGTQLVDAWIMPTATATNTADDQWVEALEIKAGNVQAGVGFDIYCKCTVGMAHGVHTIAYVFN